MRLTRAGEYAVRCALFLSFHGQEAVCSRRDIAKTMDVPDQFLSKVAQHLAREGIIEIVQGAKGGYRLLVPPEKLTMLAVVEAVIGEIFLNDCVIRPEQCDRSSSCAAHKVWEKARDQLRDTLRETTFKQMLDDDTCTTDLLKSTSNPSA